MDMVSETKSRCQQTFDDAVVGCVDIACGFLRTHLRVTRVRIQRVFFPKLWWRHVGLRVTVSHATIILGRRHPLVAQNRHLPTTLDHFSIRTVYQHPEIFR